MKSLKRRVNLFLLEDGVMGTFSILWDKISYTFFYQWYYKKIFKKYGNNVRWGKHFRRLTIPKSVRISCPHLISIGDNNQFDEGVYLQCHFEGEGIEFNDNVRCNAHTHIQAYSKIKIEEHVLIAPFCLLSSGDHGHDKDLPIVQQAHKQSGRITIGSGSWLGRNVAILGNVHIGCNCVLGANTILKNKTFHNNSIIVGNPPKQVR
ncbi:MAG: acyltransferase [bacterium]